MKKASERKHQAEPLTKLMPQRHPEEPGSNQSTCLAGELLAKASRGEITPEQAEELARSAGLPPFASQPSYSEFDPDKESYWLLVQAIAWICWRNTRLVMEANPNFCRRCTRWVKREWRSPEQSGSVIHTGWIIEPWDTYSSISLSFAEKSLQGGTPIPLKARPVQEATADLWRALSDNQLIAEAVNEDGLLVKVERGTWSRLQLFQERGNDVLKYGPLDCPAAFTDVRLKREDVTSIWRRSPFASVDVSAVNLGNISEQNFGLMLTEEAFVPFSVAVCWLATKGGLKAVSLRDETEWTSSAKSLLQRISAGQIEIIGCGDSLLSERLPPTAFDAIDCPHPHSMDVAYVLAEKTHVQCYFYSDDEHWKNDFDDQFFLEGKRRPHWTRLRLRRGHVLNFQPKPTLKGNVEVECRKWLEDLMRSHPKRPKPKTDLLEDAKRRFAGLGTRQSERAWKDAVESTGRFEWTRKGPVAKD